MTPVERAIHRRTAQLRPHANEFGGRDAAARGVQAAAQHLIAGGKASLQAGVRGMPRPGIFDWPAPSVTSAHGQERGDIGQQACGAGMASRTADGNHSGVARPSRHWATGDCTRFEKPVRLGLRQSSGAPRLPAFTASDHRDHRFFLLATRRCNEVRLLSRRIIIRLFDDVKKKVQKNLRARTSRSTWLAHRDDDIIDTLVDLDFHTLPEVPSQRLHVRNRCIRAARRARSRDTLLRARMHCRHTPRASSPARHAPARRSPGKPHVRWLSRPPRLPRTAHRRSRRMPRANTACPARSGARRCARRDLAHAAAPGPRAIAPRVRRSACASIRQLREYDEGVMRQRNGLSQRTMRWT